ncbi:MAG: HlyC/CorC family transporter [Candidatus Omnitrophica bacterium]|nr:HlyC/CorC family transporter [Candidatus Omnitrophota bacterium]
MKVLAQLLTIFILLVLAAVTAALEISIVSASRLKLKKFSLEGSGQARIVLKILQTPERFFSTILVSNNIIDTLIAVIVTAIMIHLIGEGVLEVVLSTVTAAALIIVFETTAKTIAAKYAEKMAMFMAVPAYVMIKVFTPFVKGLEAVVNSVVMLVGGKTGPKPSLVTDEEVKALIKVGQEEGTLQKDKYRMITKIFDFSEAIVRKAMTAKKDILAIDINSKLDDIINKVIESGYSRIPVYRDDPGNFIGVINMKDLLSLYQNKDLVVMQDIVYPATFVSGSKKVTDLLTEFQKGHTHMALVTDEGGNVEGLVTLEDLIEEIVGEIEDEYDVRVNNYKTRHVK